MLESKFKDAGERALAELRFKETERENARREADLTQARRATAGIPPEVLVVVAAEAFESLAHSEDSRADRAALRNNDPSWADYDRLLVDPHRRLAVTFNNVAVGIRGSVSHLSERVDGAIDGHRESE